MHMESTTSRADGQPVKLLLPDDDRRRRPWLAEKAALIFGTMMLLSVALVFFLNRTEPTSVDNWAPTNVSATKDDVAGGKKRDRLLGGLLRPDMDEGSCWSRYESSQYRKPSPFAVSPDLAGKLRAYETQHQRCGPGTANYAEAMAQLQSGKSGAGAGAGGGCKYVVWSPVGGLGNQMLSLASAFLYALLNGRTLLAQFPAEVGDLFCEPFPNASWVLPPDFPNYGSFWIYNEGHPQNYVNMLKAGRFNSSGELPALAYLHLQNHAARLTGNTFCDEDHRNLDRFQWVLVKADCFFATALFLMPMYSGELHRLFPEKEAVFHHLGRYLFHPGNKVWGMVTRYYAGYLAGADERIGIQVRVFPDFYHVPFDEMFQGITNCISHNELLPRIASDVSHPDPPPAATKKKAVVIVSLKSGYYDKLKSTYYENATASGELVTLYQPTHEEMQKTESTTHNHRALAEIYLLSLCDKLVTTAWSTFGYTAHSLAGVRPWILMKKECVRSASAEPCMLSIPTVSCAGGVEIPDLGKHVPYVRHCEDISYGLKLVDV